MLALRIDLSSIKESEVEKIAKVISKGGVVAMPTDTIYGLCTIIDREESLRSVYRIKARSGEKPLPVLVDSLEMAKSIVDIEPGRERILRRLWPNQISVILQKKACVLDLLTSGTKKVMVRWAKSDFVNAVIDRVGKPITATSANISGERPIGDGRSLKDEFVNNECRPDMIVDAGIISKSSIPSTIIDFTGETPTLVREGSIKKEEAEALMGLKLLGGNQ